MMIKSFTLLRVIILVYSLLFCVRCDKLLLLGDSIDRQATVEWCEWKGGLGVPTKLTVWGPKSLISMQQLFGKTGTYICKTPEDSIASVQLFGSNATGPYRSHVIMFPNDTFDNTKPRINLSVSSYKTLFGLPDRVIFQTVQWDAATLNIIHEFDVAEEMSRFRYNTNSRLDEILLLVGPTVDVGLRTAPRSIFRRDLVEHFNRVLREIASKRGMTIYDYDVDLWTSVNNNLTMESHLFRDWVHPKRPYSERAADKMLGRHFSNAMMFKEVQEEPKRSSSKLNFRTPSSSSSMIARVWHDKIRDAYFFYNSLNASRHANLDDNFLLTARLGPADVFHFTDDSIYNETSLGIPASALFRDRMIYNATLNGKVGKTLYYLRKFSLKPMHSNLLINGVGLKAEDVVQLGKQESSLLSVFPLDSPVLKLYAKAPNLLIGKGNTNYLVRDGFRYQLNSTQTETLVALYGPVEMLYHHDDVDFLPLGEGTFPLGPFT
jgi:hypothetical protein